MGAAMTNAAIVDLNELKRQLVYHNMLAQHRIDSHDDELVIDNFAGGGGASTGIAESLGRSPDYAINHDPQAIRMHMVNHPDCVHYCDSIWDVEPRDIAKDRKVGLVWLSPDCKHFSKAKGGTPVSKKIRGLAWIAMKWIGQCQPRSLMLENVEEFVTWGPLIVGQDGKARPDPARKGRTFRSFVNAMKQHGYQVEWKELRACDYGAPTIRKRLFLVARRDGNSIVWPKPTHGAPDSHHVMSGKLKPWNTAADIIDWNIECPSIFTRKKPLVHNTLQRLVTGVTRYVVQGDPFIVKCNHTSNVSEYKAFRGQSLGEPLQTITQSPGFAVVKPVLVPFITEHANGSSQRNMGINEPVRTICAQVKGGHFAVVTPKLQPVGDLLGASFITRQFGRSVGSSCKSPVGAITAGGGGKTILTTAWLAKHYSGVVGSSCEEPIGTVTSIDHHSLVASHLVKLRGTNVGSPVTTPVHTVTAGGMHIGEVRTTLEKAGGSSLGLSDFKNLLGTGEYQEKIGKVRELLQSFDPERAANDPYFALGLVWIKGELYQIVDIGMRMLTPRELFAAQGFPKSYIIEKDFFGKPFTITSQIARCGNAVCPPLAAALVRENLPDLVKRKIAA